MKRSGAFSTLELKAPASPRSPVTIMMSTVFSGRVSRNSGCSGIPVSGSRSSARLTTDCKTLVSICAKGRACKARSWARRSFAAETIFMALVICRVFFTLRIRRRRSSTFAIALSACLCHCLAFGDELFLVLLDDARHPVAQLVIEDLLFLNGAQQPRIAGVHEFVESL